MGSTIPRLVYVKQGRGDKPAKMSLRGLCLGSYLQFLLELLPWLPQVACFRQCFITAVENKLRKRGFKGLGRRLQNQVGFWSGSLKVSIIEISPF